MVLSNPVEMDMVYKKTLDFEIGHITQHQNCCTIKIHCYIQIMFHIVLISIKIKIENQDINPLV